MCRCKLNKNLYLRTTGMENSRMRICEIQVLTYHLLELLILCKFSEVISLYMLYPFVYGGFIISLLFIRLTDRTTLDISFFFVKFLIYLHTYSPLMFISFLTSTGYLIILIQHLCMFPLQIQRIKFSDFGDIKIC